MGSGVLVGSVCCRSSKGVSVAIVLRQVEGVGGHVSRHSKVPENIGFFRLQSEFPVPQVYHPKHEEITLFRRLGRCKRGRRRYPRNGPFYEVQKIRQTS